MRLRPGWLRRSQRPTGLSASQAIDAAHYIAKKITEEWTRRRLQFSLYGEDFDIEVTEIEVDLVVRFDNGRLVTVRAQRPECFDLHCPVMTPHEEHSR